MDYPIEPPLDIELFVAISKVPISKTKLIDKELRYRLVYMLIDALKVYNDDDKTEERYRIKRTLEGQMQRLNKELDLEGEQATAPLLETPKGKARNIEKRRREALEELDDIRLLDNDITSISDLYEIFVQSTYYLDHVRSYYLLEDELDYAVYVDAKSLFPMIIMKEFNPELLIAIHNNIL